MTTAWDVPDPELVTVAEKLSAGRALDVGCGGGHDSIWLAQQGWSVDAIDMSKHSLATVRKLASQSSLDVTAQRIDATTMSFDAEFDLVSICYIHIPAEDRLQMLVRSAMALKPWGTLLVRCFEAGIEEAPFDRALLPSLEEVVDVISESMLIRKSVVAEEYFPYMKKDMLILTIVAVRKD
ncbi:MAG: class I SAM-dependent methyltransferase [Phycisphaerales bacterium]|nr:class I SAM-dependent methyltransferase [Phycisphaerales bacterium]